MPPIAETVATPEPEIAAKIAEANTQTTAREPESQPKKQSATSTSFLEQEPLIRLPASMKKGIASRATESMPVIVFCASTTVGIPPYTREAIVAMPREKQIGMPITENTNNKMTNNAPAFITSSPPFLQQRSSAE